MKALSGQLRKIDQVEHKLAGAATPNSWDIAPFDESAARRQLMLRDVNRRREAINAEARARGEKYMPFAVGQSTLNCSTYDDQQEQAVRQSLMPGAGG